MKYNFILENDEGIAPASVQPGTAQTSNQVDGETTFDYRDGDEDDEEDDELEGRRVGGGGGGGGRGRGSSGGGGGGGVGGGEGGGGRGWGSTGGGGGGSSGGKWASTGGGGGSGTSDSYTTHAYTEATDAPTTVQNYPSTANPTTTTRPQPRTTTTVANPTSGPVEDVDGMLCLLYRYVVSRPFHFIDD